MSTIQRFEELEAWNLARALNAFSRDFALRDQIRRASISIVSNIAEGFERDGDKEFTQFLFVAKGSCGEVRLQLYLAMDCSYISHEQLSKLVGKGVEVSRVISGLINYLKHSQLSGKKYKAMV